MTDETQQPTLPPLTLVVEVPTREQLCENGTDKYAVKFAQVVQGVLFAALKAHGHSVAEIEALCTTSKSTIMGNQKMLNLRDGSEVVWGEVAGRQLHALMGGEIAAETLSPETQATMTTLEQNAGQRATEIGENAVEILDNPMGTVGGSNVVPLGGQLDPNQAAQDSQLASQIPVGDGVSYDQANAMGRIPPNIAAMGQPPAQTHEAQYVPPAQTMAPPVQQPAPQPMAPPAPAQFDVRQVDQNLAQFLQPIHIAPHPTGDPATGVQQGEMMYWNGSQWLNRVATYGAMGQQPPEMAGMQQAQAPVVPGQPSVGTPVGPQGDAVQRVQPVQGSWPHQ